MMPQTPNTFTMRYPRNSGEIETCIAMLEDSPLGGGLDDAFDREDVVKLWIDLMNRDWGSIQIVENNSYDFVLTNSTKPRSSYSRNFHSCYFVFHITLDVAREIVQRDDLQDINQFLLTAFSEHRRQPALLAPFTTNLVSELYSFYFFIWHPEIDLFSDRVRADGAKYAERTRRTMMQLFGGVEHHALIAAAYSEIFKHGYLEFGQTLLREYAGNETRSPAETRYLFGRTKNSEIASFLGIPDDVPASLENSVSNSYKILFDPQPSPRAGLDEEEQRLCYLIALGYSLEQIVKVTEPGLNPESKYFKSSLSHLRKAQNKVSEKLYDAGFSGVATLKDGKCRYSRENLQEVVLQNLHEVRSVSVPLYPWPDDHYLPM